MSQLLSYREAAEYLGVPITKIYQLTKCGCLPLWRGSHKPKILSNHLDAYHAALGPKGYLMVRLSYRGQRSVSYREALVKTNYIDIHEDDLRALGFTDEQLFDREVA